MFDWDFHRLRLDTLLIAVIAIAGCLFTLAMESSTAGRWFACQQIGVAAALMIAASCLTELFVARHRHLAFESLMIRFAGGMLMRGLATLLLLVIAMKSGFDARLVWLGVSAVPMYFALLAVEIYEAFRHQPNLSSKPTATTYH